MKKKIKKKIINYLKRPKNKEWWKEKIKICLKRVLNIFIDFLILSLIIGLFNPGSILDFGSKELKESKNIDYYDSDFLDIDESWKKDKHWEISKENPQIFVYEPDEILGGPNMTYKETISDNFSLVLNFIPIHNKNIKTENKINEINIVLGIGELFELVLRINDENQEAGSHSEEREDLFYLQKKDGELIPEINSGLKQTFLPNRIKFNKNVRIIIDQNEPSSNKKRIIKLGFEYSPDEKEKSEPVKIKDYIFEIYEDSMPLEVLRRPSIGLLDSKDSIFIEFKSFKIWTKK